MINSCFMFALSQKISRKQSVKWKTNIEFVQWILELILLLARIQYSLVFSFIQTLNFNICI